MVEGQKAGPGSQGSGQQTEYRSNPSALHHETPTQVIKNVSENISTNFQVGSIVTSKI